MLIENAYVFLLMGVTLAAMFVPNLMGERKQRR